jgi:hypothetical protein
MEWAEVLANFTKPDSDVLESRNVTSFEEFKVLVGSDPIFTTPGDSVAVEMQREDNVVLLVVYVGAVVMGTVMNDDHSWHTIDASVDPKKTMEFWYMGTWTETAANLFIDSTRMDYALQAFFRNEPVLVDEVSWEADW